jgi:lipopolysaccharide transport system ATP-binding protein
MNAVEVNHITMKFNMATEKIGGIKEYVIKLLKKELLYKEFIALDDVSLTLEQGRSLGIVGCNGAGKSTLLKCICGVYQPDEGTVLVNGTIAPLIELGAGFDGELTARENIFLNGAVMGFEKDFLCEKFDEIVDFSELENFLDVPVKNFSSGMIARLGFAVATLVKPDVLIADEVLGVGDAAFQRKCAEKMSELRSEGTSMLFVSHSIGQVQEICDDAIWLHHGKLIGAGAAADVCTDYENWTLSHTAFDNGPID